MSASTSQLQYLEALCKQLYAATSPTDRSEAEKTLSEFSESADCMEKCMMLLEQGSTAYAQLVAATTLTKLISRPNSSASIDERLQLRNYLLSHLANRSKLPAFVVSALCQLFARLTKLSWFDISKGDFEFQSSVATITKLIDPSQVEMCSLGILLLAHLVAEMNQQSGIATISKHRKIAASFRDDHLFGIFRLAIRLLQQALNDIRNFNLSDEMQRGLFNNLLQLSLNVLNYDFLGSICDESSDDNAAVPIPAAWRSGFDTSIVKLFYELYAVLPSALGALALSCLVQLSSVRRNIFNTQERQQYLAALVTCVKAILENPQALSDQSIYHEFCRLVARLKSNYQLIEFIKVEDYPKVVRMIAEFTAQSLQMYQFSANSIHYLLSFWQRMVSSMPYVKSLEPHLLEQFVPLVTKAYIESRINIVSIVIRDGIDDPLDDQSSLVQQMEQFSIISRCEYDKTCQLIIQLFDQYATAFQQAVATSNELARTLEEWRLTWLVYLIGAAIGGRQACNISEEHDIFDGDLICRVLQLMRATDSRPVSVRSNDKLEMAYLWFLEQFRKIYLSEQVQKSTKVYIKLVEGVGLTDETSVLSLFIQKIVTNLKYWSQNEKVIDDSLSLLNDLSVGYSSVRRLVRLPEIQFLLNNHTADHFSFLGSNVNTKTMRLRTMFYSSLTRLLCIEIGEDEDKFESYMSPLASALNDCTNIFNLPDASVISHESAKRAVIGLARDARGVAFSCCIKTPYIMLFDWLYSAYLNIFRRALEVWYADPDVSTPVLKFVCELCQNRNGRLQFDVSSPVAILLFKECSKFIVSYGSRILLLTDIPKDQLYRLKLKGISICFGILRAALCGVYVNFGVLHLYGDTCLDDALNMFVKLVLAVPRDDILAYTKLSHNYYFLLESIAQDHMTFFSHLDPQITVYILQTLHQGLTALDTTICTCSCTTLDFIATYLYKRVSRAGKPLRQHAGYRAEGDNILRILEVNYEILRQLLATIMNILMFEECRCQWSMSRPLLGLILLHEEYFGQLKNQLLSCQSTAKQQQLTPCFSSLMDGIERNLTSKNKDRFTQNLSIFRREVTDCLKGPGSSVSVQDMQNNVPSYLDMMS